jgi:hypothetical protein
MSTNDEKFQNNRKENFENLLQKKLKKCPEKKKQIGVRTELFRVAV